MSVSGSSRSLLTRFEIGQNSESLYARLEVGQDSADLLGRVEVQQSGSAELLGKFEAQATADLLGKVNVTHSVDLLGKFEAQATADLLGKAEVGQKSADLLGKGTIQQSDSAELFGNTEIQQSDSAELLSKFEAQATAELLSRFEVGQDTAELLGKFEAQATAELLGKVDITHSAELLGRAEVGQDSAELLGKGDVQQSGSAEFLGKFEAQITAELLGRAVIGHPALPVWLFGKFEVGLTNAYRDLGSSLEIGRSAFAELLGEFEAQATAELLGKVEVQQSGSAELFGKGTIRHSDTAEILGNAVIRGLSSADLEASVIIHPTMRDSDTYFSFWDPSDWINEVVGVGQGFIAIPWVEADTVVKTYGDSSARLTSTYASNQYKEIRFGWGGMNWGVEAGVSPEVAPTPIDTGGRGPRRGSRAERDERREVPQSSYKELMGILTVNELAGVVSQLRDITDADGWWQHAYNGGSGFLLIPNANGTLTVRTRYASGAPAYGGGAYGTNKAFIPTAGNPVTIEWEIQCNAPVVGTTFSTHFLGGLTDGRNPWSGSNEISLLYDGDTDQHVLDIYEDGVESYNGAWTAVDITDLIKFKIIWEHPDDVAPNGRIRVYVDDVLTFTETTVVPETELCFFFGVFLYRMSGTPTAEATLHSISEL